MDYEIEYLSLEDLTGQLQTALELAVAEAKVVLPEMIFAHGAVVFKGNRVLGVGHNEERPLADLSRKTIRYRSLTEFSAHAELMALKDARWFSKGSSLLTARWTRENCLGKGKPCTMCMPKLLTHPCLSRIYFSVDTEKLGMIRIRR